ncbi:MAG: extracellular solute-binding protein [Pseudomonadota bacterium]
MRFLKKAGPQSALAAAVSAVSFLLQPAHADLSGPGEPLTVNWYHGAENLQPVVDAYTEETGETVVVTNDYDTFTTDVLLVSDYKGLTEGKKFKHFQLLKSDYADKVVPPQWRDRDGYWVGVVLRARAPIYNKTLVSAEDAPKSWFDLADPKWKGQVALRGADNVYNRSLLAWMIHHYGEERARAWAKGVFANAGASPTYLGDSANAVRVSKGEKRLGFMNTYYLGYMQGPLTEKYGKEITDNVGIAWTDNDDLGQQVNVTGAAIHDDTEKPEEARAFIEWLLTEKGQRLLSEYVFKYPVRQDVEPSEYLKSLGAFRPDDTDLNDLQYYYDRVDQIYDDIGWGKPW